MTDTAVKTNALEAGIKSLASVGDRLVKLAADERLDDDREVIGDIATAMTNVRTEVAALSRRLDVVQRDSQQREYERDVARQQARDAEAREARSTADGRMTMQLMVAGCIVACLTTGFAVRWWYRPADSVAAVVQIDRTPAAKSPVTLAPTATSSVSVPTAHAPPSSGVNATPGPTGDYACAFAYERQSGCPEDVRGGQDRPTRTVR